MTERETDSGADPFASNAKALKTAFDTMERQAIALKAAEDSGDQLAFDAAVSELRAAQMSFLRIHRRFPAETALYLAQRQAEVVQGLAFDPFSLVVRQDDDFDEPDGARSDPE
ncbi:MAG: hypothetical protein BM562_16380 [Alphaproteobacteria bacterium MedPE-SWcel]|nr:MAG: hypothetical protein BM562_16380 [Alphaproteobacteria bacterium MedPE-SWcel]